MLPTTPRVPGRTLAWTALLVALAASVAGNVAYARPEIGPQLSSATAPILVVLAAGLLERVPLATARWWQRWLAGGGLVFVTGAAFVTSYQHQSALLRDYGNPELSSVLLPLAIDALIVMASVCLAVIAEQRRQLAPVPEPATEDAPEPVGTASEVSDTTSDADTTDEQPKRGGKTLAPRQRAVRLYKSALQSGRTRSAKDIAEELEAKGIKVSDRTVARWLEPHRPSETVTHNGAEVADTVTVGA